MIRTRARSTQTLVASAFTQPGLLRSQPQVGELGNEFAEPPRLEPGEDTLGQGRAAQVMLHNTTRPHGLLHVRAMARSLPRTTS
jgi:hypothetical protein